MTKRSKWAGATVVYRYGCPSWADLPDEAMRQLRLAHDLRNELVAIDKRHAELVAGIWGLHPEVAQAKAAVDDASAHVAQLVQATLAERQAARTTRPSTQAKTQITQARQALRDAKTAARAAKQAALEQMRPLFQQASQARRAAVKWLYGEYVQARGLHWATYNDVVAHHETAVRRIAEQRGQGQPADLRFHRWDGAGTLAVQLQRGAGQPQRTPDLLASGAGPWKNVARIVPWLRPEDWPKGRGPHRHGTAHLTLGRGQAMTLPIILHRPMPADADITDVRVTRRRVGAQHRLSVAVTMRLPAPPPKTTGVPVAVRLGWAAVKDPQTDGDGWVRVARIGCPDGLPEPPADIAGLLRRGYEDGRLTTVDVHASAEWAALLRRDDHIRSVRDDLLEELRPLVVQALAEDGMAERAGATAAEVTRWRSARRFAGLARRWPDDHPLAAKLEAWRRRDLHLWAFEAHERDQVVARRRAAYRLVAAWLADAASVIAMHGLDLARLRRTPAPEVEDTHQARRGRRQAWFAAPGELRAAVETAAHRRGVEVIHVTTDTGDQHA